MWKINGWMGQNNADELWFPQWFPNNLIQEVEEPAMLQPLFVPLRSSSYFGPKNRPQLPSERHFLSSGGQNNEVDLKSLIALRAFIRPPPPPSFLSTASLFSPPPVTHFISGFIFTDLSASRQEPPKLSEGGRDSLCHHHGAPWLLGG